MNKRYPENKLGRVEYMVDLARALEPDLLKKNQITSQLKLKGTTIEKLCEYPGPGYKRMISWFEEKVFITLTKTDMEIAKEEHERCYQLMLGRNAKYGDSYKCLTIPSIANLCEMKLNRISHMDTKNLDPKVEDELMDVCNYMVFGLLKLKKINEK